MCELATEWRQRWKSDVIVDIVCYPPLRAQRDRRALLHAAPHVPGMSLQLLQGVLGALSASCFTSC